MMILLVNRTTGGPMYVHESRLDEYLEKGHKLASQPKPVVVETPVKKTTRNKTASKK